MFLDSVTVTGGKLATANGSEIQVEYANTDVLAHITLTAGSILQLDNESTLDATGTLTNGGTVIVDGYNAATQFVVDAATLTLTGGGTVVLVDSGVDSQMFGAAASDMLVNVNNMILGAGLIGNDPVEDDEIAPPVSVERTRTVSEPDEEDEAEGPLMVVAGALTHAWYTNQARLRQLKSGHPDVSIFSAHDPAELDAFAS